MNKKNNKQNTPNRTSPYAYFITFTTYGTRLHGDQRGTVDRENNQFDTPLCKTNHNLNWHMKKQSKQSQIILTDEQRQAVLTAIKNTCQHNNWQLFAAHVRSNHIHLIVKSGSPPEKIMSTLKSFSTKALNKQRGTKRNKTYWTRHGSTRYIWCSDFLYPAMQYVIDGQGAKNACYYEDWYEENLG
jgi:REP element-mobilizing transposase RayT